MAETHNYHQKEITPPTIYDQVMTMSNRYYHDPIRFVKETFKAVPTRQQEIVLQSIATDKKVSVRAGHGVGKGGSKSSMIDTPFGLCKWGSLKVGDFVFGQDGNPTKIIATHELGIQSIYKVFFDDGSIVEATLDHLWNVKGRNERRNNINKWKTLSTKELIDIGVKRPNGKVLCRQWEIPNYEPVIFAYQDTLMSPYIYGAWLGDGNKDGSRFASGDEDVEHFRKEFEDAKYTFIGISSKYSYKSTAGKLFKEINQGAKVDELTVNSKFKYNSITVRLAVLQGLLDTNGNVGRDSRAEFTSVSSKLVDDVIWLARSLGLKAKKCKSKNPFYKDSDGNRVYCKTAYVCRITWNGKFDLFRLERKQNILTKNEPRYTKRWIDKIEYSHEEDSMCITVESSSGLYLTEGFVVTHNSTLASWALYWFLLTRPSPKIICTAPTFHQLYDVLWAEAAAWRLKSPMITQMFEWKQRRIELNDDKRRATWWAAARTASKGEALTGRHAGHFFLIVDEASGIEDPIFEAAEGMLTNENSYVLLIGNPTKNAGYFHDSHTKNRKIWAIHHLSCIECAENWYHGSPLTGPTYISDMKYKYGEDSNTYRVRVLGDFPFDEKDTLIPYSWVESARERDFVTSDVDPLMLGVDVGAGGDKSVILHRRGGKVEKIDTHNTKNTMELVGWVAKAAQEAKPQAIFIDPICIGKGAFDWLRELNYRLYPVDVRRKSTKPNFERLRDELWWRTREHFERGLISIPNNDDLITEVGNIKYEIKSNGKTKVESKAQMRKRNMPSPDHGDALMMTYYLDDKVFTKPIDDYDFMETETEVFHGNPSHNKSKGWMRM